MTDDPFASVLANDSGDDPFAEVLSGPKPLAMMPSHRPFGLAPEQPSLWQRLKRKTSDIADTAKRAYQEVKNTTEGGENLALGALEEAGKVPGYLSQGMIAAGSQAGNWLGLVSDKTNEENLQAILDLNKGGGSAFVADPEQRAMLEQVKQTAAGKAGGVIGAAAPMLAGGAAATGVKAAGGLGTRLLIRGAQGALVNAPGTLLGTGIEEAANTDKSGAEILADIAKREALDVGTGALFSSRVNRAFEGSTVPRVILGRAAKTGVVGTGLAAGSAAMSGDGTTTFPERFVEALPGSLAQVAAMETPGAAMAARGKALDLRAMEQLKAHEAAAAELARPQQELDSLLQRYHETTAQLAELQAQDNQMSLRGMPEPKLFRDSLRLEEITRMRAQAENAQKQLRGELEQTSANLEDIKSQLSQRGVEPWLTPELPAEPRGPVTDPFQAEAEAEYLRQWKLPEDNGTRPVVGARGQTVEMGAPPRADWDPYQPLGKGEVINPETGAPPTLLNAGLNLPQIVGEWWKGKGAERVLETPDGRQIPYRVNASGKIEFFTDHEGKLADLPTYSARKMWDDLSDQDREQAFRLMRDPLAKTSNPRVAQAVVVAHIPGALSPEVAEVPFVKSHVESVRSVFSPASASPAAQTTADISRQALAERLFEQARLQRTLDPALDQYKGASLDDFKRVMDFMEGNRRQPLKPGELEIVQTLRGELEKRRQQLEDLGILKPGQGYNDYFGRAWQQGEEPSALMQDWNRPIEGAKSFAKERAFPTGHEAMVSGLVPDTMNPVEMQLWKMRQMDKAIAGRKIVNELVDRGMLLPTDAENIPPEWKKVGGLGQEYYADPSVKQVLDNMLSKGLRGKTWYDSMATLNNALNQAQLGFSLFHGGFVASDSTASRAAIGAQRFVEGAKSGNADMLMQSVKDFGMAGTVIGAPIENAIKGRKIIEDVHAGKIDAPLKLLLEGGMHFEMDPMYKIGSTDKFKAAIDKARMANEAGANGQLMGAVAKAAWHAPFAGLEQAFRPIGEYFVPWVKAAAAYDMAKFELERLGPDASIDARRAAARQVVDSIDNRMGQLAYDNLFWNRTAKDLAHLATRSVGWNVGTARELVGGSADLLRGRFTHRASYTLMLPVTTAWMGILYQTISAFLKGKPAPDIDAKTLKGFPATGDYNAEGIPERVQNPGYMGDVWKFTRDPLTTIAHKAGPLLSGAIQFKSNRDFYGRQIYDKTADPLDQAEQVGKYVASQFVPFSARNIAKIGAEHGVEPGTMAGSMVGFTPAPAWVNKTNAENLLGEFGGEKRPMGGASYSEAQREAKRKDFTNLINRSNQGDSTAQAEMERLAGENADFSSLLIKRGKGGPEARAALNLAKFSRLPMDRAWAVYKVATPEEKAAWGDKLRMKYYAYRSGKQIPTDADDKIAAHIAEELGEK